MKNSPSLQRWRIRLADRRLHEFLWYCVPGVLAGLLIRVWLTAAMPYGHYHFDTPDFLQTPYDLLHGHRLTLHFKKTFLTPLLYTLPFVCRVPALVVIPVGQHALGLLQIVLAGALCRLWFVQWRWWIVPLTVLAALHPAFLWFEHTLLAETHYVFGVVWVALAGSLLARRLDWERLGFLGAALLWTAGARPEGRMFLAFGFLLVGAPCWRRWRREGAKLLAYAVFSVVVALLTRTGQAGVLLYASILHLAPDSSRVAPDVADVLRPLRERLRRERAVRVANDVVRTEKRLTERLLASYSPQHPDLHLENPKRLSGFCLKLAVEAARARPLQLPVIVADRFLARVTMDTGGQFRDYDLQSRLTRSLQRGADRNAVLGQGLAGAALDNDAAISAFVHAHYDERRVEWFNRWESHWMDAINAYRLPDVPYSAETTLPGVPWFYIAALAGALCALVSRSGGRLFHRTFLPVLAGVWFTVTLTGALMPRYRVVLEPFWLLYLFSLADALARLRPAAPATTPGPAETPRSR